MYKCGLILGRFSPLHLGHEMLIKEALNQCEKVIIFIGSANKIDIDNPFSYEIRKKLIERSFNDPKLIVCPINDIGVGDVFEWGDYLLNEARKIDENLDLIILGQETKTNHWFRKEAVKHIDFLKIDRSIINISASELREALLNNNKEKFLKYTNKNILQEYENLQSIIKTVSINTTELSLNNDLIDLTINNYGGHLSSIFYKLKNKEIIYQPIKDCWQGQDIFIFPFIGRLKEQKYTYLNNEYTLKNHGLLRYMNSYIYRKNNMISCIFYSNDETIKRYPFKFKAKVDYILLSNTVTIKYEIINIGNIDMPFMFGCHPAFKLDSKTIENKLDISSNYLEFNHKIKTNRILFDENYDFIIDKKETNCFYKIELSKDMFEKINTYVYEGQKINKVSLIRGDDVTINLYLNNPKYVALWSDLNNGDFICVEPWFGLPDFKNATKEFTAKREIRLLKPNENFEYSYKIEII